MGCDAAMRCRYCSSTPWRGSTKVCLRRPCANDHKPALPRLSNVVSLSQNCHACQPFKQRARRIMPDARFPNICRCADRSLHKNGKRPLLQPSFILLQVFDGPTASYTSRAKAARMWCAAHLCMEAGGWPVCLHLSSCSFGLLAMIANHFGGWHLRASVTLELQKPHFSAGILGQESKQTVQVPA